MHVVGTAGHVDHGKSSLVRALTGVDPDRWLEEQRRGMTLDLGFAPLTFDDGTQAGIIDVPGHERFLHNMLAGAGGMEVVLLVIAANEGPKPQTFEHLAILRYLNVARTLIVLSKIDTVSSLERSRAEQRLREDLQQTIAAGATVLPVSTVTGAGLAELRATLHATLLALPKRTPDAPAYLPIDRVFALAGHGTIVTGTLMQGCISVGETLMLSPLGRSVRVRSLQVFGENRKRVSGGTRVAVNLPGVERDQIGRGAVLASAQFTAATRFAVSFTPLAGTLHMFKRRTPVRAYIGAAEILGTLVCGTVPARAVEVEGTLHLRVPTVAVPGAPFVVRRVSPMDVLGGGTIAAASSEADHHGSDGRDTLAVIAALTNAGLTGATAAAIGAAANLSEERTTTVIAALIDEGRVLTLIKPPAFVSSEHAQALFARVIERLEQRQADRPWQAGTTSLALAQAIGVSESILVRVLASYVEAGRVVYRGGYYSTLDFRPRLSAAQRSFFDAIFAAPSGAASVPVAFDELRSRMKASNVADIMTAFETLVITGSLSKVGDTVYRGEQIVAIRLQLERALKANGEITVAQFRDATGSSRKYAVPLLEFFDATGVTIRNGDVRTLRRR